MPAYILNKITNSFLLFRDNDYKYTCALAFLVDWLEIDCYYWQNSANPVTFLNWSAIIGALWATQQNV